MDLSDLLGPIYDEQTRFDAFSSHDLVHWTKSERILEMSGVSWAKRAMWAPSPVERNGRYYYYFAANDIQSDAEYGGIGVATSAGHHGVLQIPGTDEWYIVYHRRPLSRTDRNHRVVCIDRMNFAADGSIEPVRMTFEGIAARPTSSWPAE